ncbi:MAG: NAD(+)/NADH kinase [Ignavibacteriales bacterium]|nr:NAD(+)/NADH kinase [Ignavibacteriales bacterium]
MTIGIIPNTSKENIVEVVSTFTSRLKEFGFDFILCKALQQLDVESYAHLKNALYKPIDEIFKHSDLVVSIGGDGTMLTTAHHALEYGTPILGLNFGKLGFLAEFEMNKLDLLLTELKNNEYSVEERIVLEGDCLKCHQKKFFSINDIVIDKGGWPKMIEISIRVDDNYVTTFSADGLILATPTGSTGYSLSTGGPVVDQKADVITLCPISPHTLTMRPIVLASHQKIYLTVSSHHTEVNINCDGQRVHSNPPPLDLVVYKSTKKVKLIRTNSINYFKILREKLFWGMDVRKNSSEK